MAFNGSGVYSPPGTDFPAVTQTVISSTKYNNVINDIATALSLCLTKDGQQTATANIPFGGFRATNVGITAVAGSVGTPAINVSDATTGLYRSAVSELAVSIAGTQRARFDATGLIVTGAASVSSVVTPLVQATSGAALNLGADGTAKYQISVGGSLLPVGDNTQNIGSNVARLATVFTPIIDSGTTGSLSLKTNNGTTQLTLSNSSSHSFRQDALTGTTIFSNPILNIATNGSGRDATINLNDIASTSHLISGMNGILSFGGAGGAHFQVIHGSGVGNISTRNITVTGSNGGNPTIGVTAGSLAITPSVVFAGATIVQNSQSAAYTTVAADANKHILHPTADNNPRTFTIDSNANVPYSIGTAITFVNQINTLTIAITTDTLTFAPAGTTGSRTLAANGIATALKISATGWLISGTGLS